MHLEVIWLLMLYHKLNMCCFQLLTTTLTSLKEQDITCAFSQHLKDYANL
jgi:hypothetical protein